MSRPWKEEIVEAMVVPALLEPESDADHPVQCMREREMDTSRMVLRLHRFLFLPALLVVMGSPVFPGRVTMSLNGTWEIGESVDSEDQPSAFSHTVPVPGLVSLATPPFPDAGRFDSNLYMAGRIRLKLLDPGAMTEARGVSRQVRNYFWYSKRFRPAELRQVAVLRIAKAQFGTAVWLNGKKIGEHFGCFTAGFFNLTEAIDWKGENRLVVRLGAHPLAVPETVPTGTDPSKNVIVSPFRTALTRDFHCVESAFTKR